MTSQHQQQQQPSNLAAAISSSNNPSRNNNAVRVNNNNNVGMYNWQSTKMTVKERLTFMFNNEILADVHFIVGKDR